MFCSTDLAQFGPNPVYYITFGHVYTSWLVLTFKSRITNFYETFTFTKPLQNLTPSAKCNIKENIKKQKQPSEMLCKKKCS